jgi:hypothetical protein
MTDFDFKEIALISYIVILDYALCPSILIKFSIIRTMEKYVR